MKKLITIVLCFVLLNQATAQADKVILDNVFQNINKATIPTGYLQDYGVAYVNKESYNGILTDSNAVANLSAFRLMYNDIYTAKINPSATSMPTVSNINSTLEPLQGNTATPLIFNISNIAGFEPDALLDGKVTFTNNQFFPVAGQNPWVTNKFFAACPIDEVSPTTNSLTLTYNSSLVYSNCGKQISNVSINFYNGAGYQNLPLGGTLTQAYTDSSGYKPFAIKVVCTDGSMYECYSLQYVHVVNTASARFAVGNILLLADNVNFFNAAPIPKRGTMQVIYSTKRPVGHPQYQKIVKPLIIINGLDETDVNPNAQASEKKNLRSLLNDWNALSQFYDFNSQLDDVAGYDLIYINYYTLDKIEHNADMFISMINWINANKVGTEQNVVMGIELGGLISRYALAKMTRNSQPHQTRLLITHDAPHQGAYMPLGYQHLAEDFGEMDYWGTPFRKMISDFEIRQKLKNSPVFLQFYLHKVDGATVSYNSFLSPSGAYQTMVNLSGSATPPTYQFVATSQGSQCGTPILTPGVNMLKYEEKIDDDPFALLPSISTTLFKTKVWGVTVSLKIGVGFAIAYKTKLSINALPSAGTSKEISYAAMEREIFIKIKFKLCVGITSNLSACVDLKFLEIKLPTGGVITQGPFKRYNPINILPFESFAGSTKSLDNFNFSITGIAASPLSFSTDLWKKLFIYIGFNVPYLKINKSYNITYSDPTFSYISRVSALDIANPVAADYTQPLIQPLNGLNRSRASKYVCQEVTSVGGANLFNLASGRFTKRNALWMFKNMENQSTLAEDCIGFADCYNTNNLLINGEDVVCVSKPYNIPNIPSIASVAWSSYPTTIASPSPTNQPNTNVTRSADGDVLLTATITHACITTPIVITKEIYVGPPPTNHTILGWQTSSLNNPTVWRFEAIPLPGCRYQWYLDNSRYINTGSDNILDVPVPCKTQFSIKCKIMNECGMSNFSNSILTNVGYCKPTKAGISTFPIDQPIYAPKRLNVTVATSSSELFGHLFYNKESLANEMIQGVNVYSKSGNIIMQTGALNTKATQLDFTNQPDGTYFIEVLGKEDFRELHTFYYSQFNQEEYILDNIANGSIVINGDRASERLYVMQQKLFNDLQCNADAMEASNILQDFAKANATGSFGFIWLIQNALGKDQIEEAATLLERWEPINSIDNNFKNYYQYYIKIINNSTLEEPELETLHSIAQGCPLTDGEIVYAARDLYNYLDSTNTDDYSNACSSIGLRMQHTNKTEITGFSKVNNMYPNPTKGNITIDNLDYGTKIINVCNIYGKSIVKQQTNNKTININLNLNAGIYFVNITNTKTGKTETQKLIINN